VAGNGALVLQAALTPTTTDPHQRCSSRSDLDRECRDATPNDSTTPGHIAPITQVNGTNELMTQIHDA
jgi:hypothetical protein